MRHDLESHQRKSVTFISQYFPPERTPICLSIFRALNEISEVNVLTSNPNYPDGKLFEGYEENSLRTEIFESANVLRIPCYPSHDSSALNRIRNYFQFALIGIRKGASFTENSKLNFVYGSPATAITIAWWAKFRSKTPYVVMVQDLWPDSIYATGFLTKRLVKTLVAPFINLFIRSLYSNAEVLIAISKGMKLELIKRGFSESRVVHIYNWVEEFPTSLLETPNLRSELGLSADSFVFLYAGNIGPAQNLQPLVESFHFLDSSQNIHLVLVGDGVSKQLLVNLTQQAKFPNVFFLDSVSVDVADCYMSQADVCVVSLAPDPLFEITFPSKVQRIMSLGRPIFGLIRGDVAEVIHTEDAGWVCDTDNPSEIANQIAAITKSSKTNLDAKGANARHFFDTTLSSNVNVDLLKTLVKKVMS